MHGITSATHSSTDLCAKYSSVRSHTEYLCEPLEIEDYIPQPVVDVSPAKWNIAHTTWFFEEMILKQHLGGYRPFDPAFSFLFNSYYNSVGDRTDRTARGDLSRPTVEQVFEYRRFVDERMLELLSASISPELEDLTTLGLNHEQQHQELLVSDLKFMFGINPLFPAYRIDHFPEERSEENTDVGSVSIPEGIYEIGFGGDGFCFDNELARHKQYVEDLSISHRLVTNSEYLEFMEQGGYSDHRLWHSEGWDWVNQNSISSPLHWHLRDGQWHAFTLGGLRPVALEAPVCHVSYYEAAAFAEWSGMRLPTEFEWEIASDRLDWGRRWEWTNSAYLPYPGFDKRPGAIGEYNGKFMVNQMVLRGASIATPTGHSRNTYRNFFHPHLRWQFTGIRLAEKG